MTSRHMFTNAAEALQYIQVGKVNHGTATVTIKSRKTETRYTYRIRESDDGKVKFVSVMYGSDNETSYKYIGVLRNGEFQHTQKSKVEETDQRFIAFKWTYKCLTEGKLPESVEIWHEGHCGRCGRKLTVPESIARGIGPECWNHVGGKADVELLFDEEELKRLEAEGDRLQTIRDEKAKWEARQQMESGS